MRRFALVCLTVLAMRPASAGGLYVAAQDAQSVLEFSPANGSFVRVVASTISQGFSNPGGIALRPSDGVLHVTSESTGEIWRYTTATGALITPALKTGLQGPRGLAFDATGATLFFADPLDSLAETTDTLKKLALPGATLSNVGTVVGAELCGVAVSGAQVFATDSDNNRVLSFPASGGSATTVIGTGLLEPMGILLRSATQMLIADRGSNRVLEYQLSGGSWVFSRVVLPASAGVVGPCGLALAPDGRLTVSGCDSNNVVLVDLTTLAVTTLVAPGAGGLGAPKDLTWSGSTLLVASATANAVLYYDAAGNPTGVRARGLSPVLDGGIAFSRDGQRLLIASFGGNEVVEYDAASGLALRTFGSVCGFLPSDVVYGPDGLIYVACLGDNGVSRVDPVSGASLGAFVLGGSGGLESPRSLAFGPDRDLYVSSATGEILKYDGATGAFLSVFVDASGNGGGPLDPYGLAFHQGRLYVASNFPSEVKAFHATTGAFVSTFVPSGAGGLSGPTALAFGPGGDLFVASHNDNAVRRYDGTTGAFESVFVASGSGGLAGPSDLAFRPGPASVPALPPAAAVALLGGLVAAARAASKRLRSAERRAA
jgi:DNA-binding beta-propeller fold protein YncE